MAGLDSAGCCAVLGLGYAFPALGNAGYALADADCASANAPLPIVDASL
jgi:hypothetical protein